MLSDGGVVAVAECNGDGELAVEGDVDLAHDGDVAVERLTELPGHLHVGGRDPGSRRWCRRSRRRSG